MNQMNKRMNQQINWIYQMNQKNEWMNQMNQWTNQIEWMNQMNQWTNQIEWMNRTNEPNERTNKRMNEPNEWINVRDDMRFRLKSDRICLNCSLNEWMNEPKRMNESTK